MDQLLVIIDIQCFDLAPLSYEVPIFTLPIAFKSILDHQLCNKNIIIPISPICQPYKHLVPKEKVMDIPKMEKDQYIDYIQQKMTTCHNYLYLQVNEFFDWKALYEYHVLQNNSITKVGHSYIKSFKGNGSTGYYHDTSMICVDSIDNFWSLQKRYAGEKVVLGKNVSIGKNVYMENCLVLDDSTIGCCSVLINCIVGPANRIGKWCHMRNTITSIDVSIGERIVLDDCKICSHKSVESYLKPGSIVL